MPMAVSSRSIAWMRRVRNPIITPLEGLSSPPRPSGEAETSIDFSLRPGTAVGEGMPILRRQGGLPIIRGGVVDGACGVSGANNNEEDERCARAGLVEIGARANLQPKDCSTHEAGWRVGRPGAVSPASCLVAQN
jgi:Haem degrading protein HbpS-like